MKSTTYLYAVIRTIATHGNRDVKQFKLAFNIAQKALDNAQQTSHDCGGFYDAEPDLKVEALKVATQIKLGLKIFSATKWYDAEYATILSKLQ